MSADNANSTPTVLWDPTAKNRFAVAAFTEWGHLVDVPLRASQTLGRLGATPAVDIALPSQVLSALHGTFETEAGQCTYQDLGSSNGTLLNGALVREKAPLTVGDALAFAPQADAQSIALKLVVLQLAGSPAWQQVPLASFQEVKLGRQAEVQLADEFVSQAHATIFQGPSGLAVIDLASTNGVYVNGKRIQGTARLSSLDVVRIGSTCIVCTQDDLWISHDTADVTVPGSKETTEAQSNQPKPSASSEPVLAPPPSSEPASAPTRPDAPTLEQRSFAGDSLAIDIVERSVWDRVRKKTLLRNFHLRIDPGDFVLVLGGSGAGKSTFINAVMGNDHAEGTVRLGDLDVYEEYDRLRYQIGYVPQQDLLRLNDTVEDTLVAAAQMRMPAHTSYHDCVERASWASQLLGLSRESSTLVGRLSGGQRKRLSIAVELVGNPSLFFLDEPDSGLDGTMARSLMVNLRSIADLGKMVLIITHGPDRALDLFTKVLVLAKSERDGSGHMAFYGSVDEALAHFGTTGLEAIVQQINRVDEGGQGLADHYIDLWEGRQQ